MSKILELRQKRSDLWDQARNFLETHQDTNGGLSAEDVVAYDAMEAEVIKMGKNIERLEAANALTGEMKALQQMPLVSPLTPQKGRASDAYRAEFWNALRGKPVTDSLKESVDADGGYLVPDEFEHQLIEALESQNIMRRLATVIRTASGERTIPVVASKGDAAWVDEEALIPESGDTFDKVTLSAWKLATMIKVSQELMQDSAFSIEAYIAKEFARRIGAKEEEAFFGGDGTKKPTGLLSNAQVGKTVSSPTAITFDDLIDLYYALNEPYRGAAVFIANESSVKNIRKLKDANGQYIWQASVKEGEPDRILGRPIFTSRFMPTMAAGEKAVAFGDFSYYWIADRQNRTFQRLNELYATTGQVGFIATQRVDGKLILPEAVQVLAMAAASK
jgi:HK97 family phage major capsid protein